MAEVWYESTEFMLRPREDPVRSDERGRRVRRVLKRNGMEREQGLLEAFSQIFTIIPSSFVSDTTAVPRAFP